MGLGGARAAGGARRAGPPPQPRTRPGWGRPRGVEGALAMAGSRDGSGVVFMA
jgi:hypothetical protein